MSKGKSEYFNSSDCKYHRDPRLAVFTCAQIEQLGKKLLYQTNIPLTLTN